MIIKFIKNLLTLRWLALIIGFFLPINKNKIVITVNSGSGYCDNPKYIAEELLKNKDLKIIWLTSSNTAKESLPKEITSSRYNKFSSIIHLMTAAVWIDNSRKSFLYKKKKTLYIQTWHGGGLYKKVEKDVEDKLPKNYINIAKKDSKAINIIISDCKEKTKHFFNSFWYNGYVFESGLPRNDIIIKSTYDIKIYNEIRRKIFNNFDIPLNKKIILYAPTFRNDGSMDSYDLDYSRILKVCKEKYNNDFIFLLRLHPNIAMKSNFFKFDNKEIFNATFYSDVNELLVATDILITDYSSINFDFSFTNRPSFRFVKDLDKYYDDRGFYMDISEYPYPLAKSNDELEEMIKKFDEIKFKHKNENFMRKLGVFKIDNASVNVSNLVIDYINTFDFKKIICKYSLVKKEDLIKN